jgi:16S rRNA processing protein RimM
MTENRLVGKIKQAHGLRGEVYILIFSKDISWIKKLKEVSLNQSGKTKTFKVLKAKPFKDGFIASLDSIIDRNQSEALEGSEVWLESKLFKSEPSETPYLIEVQNFSVIDRTLGELGQVTDFSFNGSQDLLIVTSDNGSVFEIPFVDQFVLKIDSDQKVLSVDLPEGLVEINSSANESPNDGQDDNQDQD